MSYCIKIWGSIIIITTAAPKELSVHKSAYRIVHLQTNYAHSNPPKNFRNCKRKFICRISRTNLIEKNLEPIVFLNQWAFWLEPRVATMKQWNHHFDAVIICMKMFCLLRILNSSSSNSSSNCWELLEPTGRKHLGCVYKKLVLCQCMLRPNSKFSHANLSAGNIMPTFLIDVFLYLFIWQL